MEVAPCFLNHMTLATDAYGVEQGCVLGAGNQREDGEDQARIP